MKHTYLSKISLSASLLIILLILDVFDFIPDIFETHSGPTTWINAYLFFVLVAIASGIASLVTERTNKRAKWYAISSLLISIGSGILIVVAFIMLAMAFN